MKYTTTRGIEIEVLSIPLKLVEKITAMHQDPDPPTYEVETLGGSVERHSLADVKDAGSLSDDERAQLAEWKAKAGEVEARRNEAFLRLVMLRGIRVDVPDDDTWMAEHKLLGVDVPDDPTQRRLHYIESEVFGGLSDYSDITRLVMEASGVSAEAIRQASDTFPGAVEREIVGNTSDPVGPMGILTSPATCVGGRENGDNDQSIRRTRRIRQSDAHSSG